jgi:2-methylcitrate dehydratase PrpD
VVSVTQELVDFTVDTAYQDLPSKVVRECKHLLLDSTGCALGGLNTEKGRISVALAKRMGGSLESTIIGTGNKVSSASAAFANGELINALDYDALFFPDHVSPFVLAAPLAIAELVGASGKDLIVAIALSHELPPRIAAGLVSKEGFALGVPGYGLCIFGGAAAAGKMLKLSKEKMCHALGIAGRMCPIPTLMKFATTVPSTMDKYMSAGWISQAEVTSVLLAEMGYIGDREVLDGEHGFWRSFTSDGWNPGAVTKGLGQDWYLPGNVSYKAYPCCGAMQGALKRFCELIDENNLQPDDIEQVRVLLNPLVELPLWQNRQIQTHIEAQFNVAYVFAVAAYRVEIGPQWQDPNTFRNPEIVEFMNKISFDTYSNYYTMASQPVVEVMAKGKGSNERKVYSKGFVFPGTAGMNDEELVQKFRRNASGILSQRDTDRAIRTILELEELRDVSQLLKVLNP